LVHVIVAVASVNDRFTTAFIAYTYQIARLVPWSLIPKAVSLSSDPDGVLSTCNILEVNVA
jgi:hypothetical protein